MPLGSAHGTLDSLADAVREGQPVHLLPRSHGNTAHAQITEAPALYTRSGYQETTPYEGHGKADRRFAETLQ